MTKTLKHYKKQHNKTQRRVRKGGKGRKGRKGGQSRMSEEIDLAELKELMGQPDRHLFALHSSEGCGHCKRFKPEWERIMSQLSPRPNLTVAKLGPGATDYMNAEHYAKHNYAVNGVPTIIYYIVNKQPREYNGERTAEKIIAWLTQVMADNNLEITIKPKSQQDASPYPEEVPVSNESAMTHSMATQSVTTQPDDESMATQSVTTQPDESVATQSVTTQPDDESVATQSVTTQPQDTIADAFPLAPLPPASTFTETISTTANNLNNSIKSATESARDAATNAASEIGTKLKNLFSSSPASAPAPVPAVPSLVGGVKRRKMTRRKHRRSKSSRKTKKSRK